MKKSKFFLTILTTSLCLASSLASVANAKTVLNLNNSEEPSSFNPALGFNSNSWEAVNNLMEGLVRLDEKHIAQPAAAEKYEILDGGKTYKFYLHKDAKWSNGDNVTANDFVFAWNLMLNQQTKSPAAFLAYDIVGAKSINEGKGGELGVKALDDYTLEVKLEKPNVAFLNILTNPNFSPVNRKVAESNPQLFSEASSYVSNGAFALEKWEHSKGFVLKKNQYYWDNKNVHLDEIDYVMVNDPNTYYQMYVSGDLDVAPTPPSNLYDSLKDKKEFHEMESSGEYFFRFNVTMPPFQNKNIRKAFAMAVNRDDIAKFVVKRGRKAAYGFVSPGFIGPDGKDFRATSGDLIKFDVAEAKKLLEKGMAEEKYTQLPTITLSIVNSPDDKKIAETLQNLYKQNLGVNIEIQSMESKVFFAKQRASELQFSRSSFLNDYADPYNSLETFLTDASSNRTKWSNADYDKLIGDARNEVDAKKRWDMLVKAEKILIDEAPIFPLYYYNQIYMQKPNVSGILRHPVGWIDLKSADKK